MRLLRILKRAIVLVGVVALTLLAVRAWDAQRGEPLELWHTFVPDELDVAAIDRADWSAYVAAENAMLDEMRVEVTQKLDPEDRVPVNRYFEGSPVYPGHFARDWNRSYVLEPDGPPVGAVVFLHGLTDSPYSLRHIARRYRERGYVTVAIRLPGHGTVPGGLTGVRLGRLDGGDATGGAGSAPPRRSFGAAAPRRLLQRRRAGLAVCAGCSR